MSSWQLTVDRRDFLAAGDSPGPAPAKTPCSRAATACVRAVKLLRLAGSPSSPSPSSISWASARCETRVRAHRGSRRV